jgi:hypothetical protein
MDFKPNEFFIGLVEFITILLPGAVLAFLFLLIEKSHPVQENHLLFEYALSAETVIIFWVFFIFSSFGFGYFLSSTASGLDTVYDMIRKQIYPYEEILERDFKFDCLSDKQQKNYIDVYKNDLLNKAKKECMKQPEEIELDDKKMTYEGYKIRYKKNIIRRIFHLFFELEYEIKMDESYGEAKAILLKQPKAVQNASNAFKWASIVLQAAYPVISEQTTRIMAASKFFRSMVIVMFIFLLLQSLNQIPDDFWRFNFLILIFSFREYIVQRQKCLQRTYQSIVTLAHLTKEGQLDIKKVEPKIFS